jgi:hypothetical protein
MKTGRSHQALILLCMQGKRSYYMLYGKTHFCRASKYLSCVFLRAHGKELLYRAFYTGCTLKNKHTVKNSLSCIFLTYNKPISLPCVFYDARQTFFPNIRFPRWHRGRTPLAPSRGNIFFIFVVHLKKTHNKVVSLSHVFILAHDKVFSLSNKLNCSKTILVNLKFFRLYTYNMPYFIVKFG